LTHLSEINVRATDSHLEARQESTAAAFALFVLLVFADAGFTLLHLINVETGWLRGTGISLEYDGGPSEIYQYVKEFWIVVCLLVAFVSTRYRAYLGWATALSYLLIDDAGQIHENVGAWLGQRYQFAAPLGLRSQDIGELLVTGAAGLVAVTIVGAALWRGSEQCRRISRDMGLLIVALAVVGVVVDVMHVVAYYAQSLLAQVLLVVEDGGEMIVMSALTAYAFHLAMHLGHTRFDLWSALRLRIAGDRAHSVTFLPKGLPQPSFRTPETVRELR
jgi:hypothetical protein